MKTYRLSARIDEITYRKLTERALIETKDESQIVREALAAHLDRTVESAYDALKRVGGIGIAKGLPRDLSTNKKYLEGFGTRDSAGSPGYRSARRSSRS